MSLEDIISVTISAATTTVSRKGFGTPLIATPTTLLPSRIRTYKTLAAMTDDGWAATSAGILVATRVASQNPKPAEWKIGRRDNKFVQKVGYYPKNLTQGFIYKCQVVVGTTTTEISYTVPAAATALIVIGALTALFTAIAGVTAAAKTDYVEIVTDTAGVLVDYVGVSTDPDNVDFKDLTADPGLAADLAAFEAEDPDGWYCLLLDSNSPAEILAAAAWIEARKKIFITNTSDTGCPNNVITNDVMSVLKSFSYVRTAILYSQVRLLNWSGAAWAGNRLPSNPGSSTWAFKTLAGCQVDSKLTGGQIAVIESKHGNVYRTIAGVNVTTFGITCGGEWIDVTRFIDWLDARIKERIFFVLVNNAKIPYTDLGVDTMRAQVLAQLNEGITVGGLADDPAPLVTAPKVSDIDPNLRAMRILPDISFTATLAGAIHQLQISGVLSV